MAAAVSYLICYLCYWCVLIACPAVGCNARLLANDPAAPATLHSCNPARQSLRRFFLSHLEGKPVDYAHFMRCQRAALDAAAFDDAQQSNIVAAYRQAAKDVQKLQAEMERLQAQLVQVCYHKCLAVVVAVLSHDDHGNGVTLQLGRCLVCCSPWKCCAHHGARIMVCTRD